MRMNENGIIYENISEGGGAVVDIIIASYIIFLILS